MASRKRKPLTMRLAPKSDRTVERLAHALAFNDLRVYGGPEPDKSQNAWRNRARELLESLAKVQP